MEGIYDGQAVGEVLVWLFHDAHHRNKKRSVDVHLAFCSWIRGTLAITRSPDNPWPNHVLHVAVAVIQ